MEPRQTKSHAELEQYHYQALLNPYYLAEGLADVLREDLMMNMPIPGPEPIPVEQVIVHRHADISKQEYDLLQQTALRVRHLEGQLKELKAKRKPKRYQQYKNS